MAPLIIQAPGTFAPLVALGFGAAGAGATAVDADAPLPVRPAPGPSNAAPLVGTADASGSVGPFLPDLGRAIWLTLSGDWRGTVRVLRSVDGGATRRPLTLGGRDWGTFAAGANEPIAEESVAGASYWLAIALSSGSVAYEVRQ